MAENIGKVISVSGPAVDIQFVEANMPPIYQALRITSEGFDVPKPLDIIVEVEHGSRGPAHPGPRVECAGRAGG
jgi:F-type H+-transporting ATPase subunit beta